MREVLLHPSLSAAACGRDLVLLDHEAGVYDLMAGAAEAASVSASGRRLLIGDAALEDALRAEGRLAAEPLHDREADLPALPRASALDDPDAAWSLKDWSRFLLAWADLSRTYWRRPFATATRPPTRSSTKSADAAAALRRARGAHQRLPWLPIQGDCLFRCALLLRTLTPADRREVRWVFGVRTWPFYAHCWLQQGETVLTDHFEPLSGFSVIHAV